MIESNRIPLAQLPRALRELTGASPSPYQALYHRVLNCELPAEQHNGRWFVARADLPVVAERLGLIVPGKQGQAA